MDIKLFDYSLPQELIAQKPLNQRDNSRLLVLGRRDGSIKHDHFYNLGNYLKKGDVLVINKSRVNNCRLFGKKEKTGAAIECFVLGRLNGKNHEVLLRPSKRLKEGDRVYIGEDYFQVKEKREQGKAIVDFSKPVGEIFEKSGEVPLPPYIKSRNIDGERYQTVYAEREGSTAAPTAGLHFTPELMDRLKDNGIIFASLFLDIGLDTFRPVSADTIEDHKMHEEHYSIEEDQARIIDGARKEGRRVIAVGTTSTRVLETVIQEHGKIRQSSGSTGIYIYPPYKFKAIDGMITNFHLPRSTLLLMVSAFAGRENILDAYKNAKEKKYRFYSFGDCMFII
jgi:S-adenosylmethionine:tRNA ribosyltransferase-isomerase